MILMMSSQKMILWFYDSWLLNVKQQKGESRMLNIFPKCPQSCVTEQEVKWSLFTEFILETSSAVLFILISQQLPQHDSRRPWPLKCLPGSCCWPRGLSCRAKLCRPSPAVDFLRTLSDAYQPLFRGDELLLIVLFKWAKQTRRSCVRFWHWLRRTIVIHCHVSVITY